MGTFVSRLVAVDPVEMRLEVVNCETILSPSEKSVVSLEEFE